MKKTKLCPECNLIKSIDEFYKRGVKSKYYCSACKKCMIKINSKHVLNNRERINKLKREKWKYTNHYTNEKYKKYAHKSWARGLVYWAKQRGVIKQEPCIICGELKSCCHHPNYTHPFRIVWLCRQHHVDVHWDKINVDNKIIDYTKECLKLKNLGGKNARKISNRTINYIKFVANLCNP